ncbi:MAG: ATP-grasp domain-containing protein [Acidiferrobacterales bacterium]|nr:ATP-grasp domain-containing protein [Acidiferrobacterales bacterium]
MEQVVDSIVGHLERKPICAVLAPDEKFLEVAAKVAHRLNLPHNRLESLKTSVNKVLARTLLSRSDVLVPEFWTIELDGDLAAQMSEVQYPCVAKPINLSASRGVIRADNDTQLVQAIQRIRDLLRIESGSELEQPILVERYIPGSEHSLEGYLSNGELETVCIFDKPQPLDGPYFEEIYFVTPSIVDEPVQEKIHESVLKACQAYGLQTGPVHAEVRVNNSQVWILEVAARSIGGDCARLFELATNSSLEQFILCKSAGQSTRRPQFQRACGVAMMPISAKGVLRRIEGVIDAQAVEGVLDVRIDVRAGEKLTPLPEGGKYPGFIYAEADTPALAEISLREALSNIKFVCMPELPVTVK